MGPVTGSTLGTGGRTGRPDGWDIWDWVNQYWADLTKNALVYEKHSFGQFWPFLDLLDLKNASGSRFYTGKWYPEVWKPKIKIFRDSFPCQRCPPLTFLASK